MRHSTGRIGALALLTAVILITTFNLGAWVLLSTAETRLRREFGQRLLAAGEATVAGLDRARLETLDKALTRQFLATQLREIRQSLELAELYLIDSDRNVVLDSRTERTGWTAAYLDLQSELLTRAWAGRASVSGVHVVDGESFMDAFIPVADFAGDVALLLVVEDSPEHLAVFATYRHKLYWVGLASALVIALLLFAQLIAFRRLLAAQSMAAETERYAALGRLGATVAHEIRNPLTAISASVQAVLRRYRRNGQVNEEMLEDLPHEVERVNAIITDFLAYSRETPLAKEALEVEGFLEDVLRRAAPEGKIDEVPVTLAAAALGPAEVWADGGKLQQLIQNLLVNGAQAVASQPQPGMVRLRSSRGRLRGRQAWRIEVEDSGAGVPEDDRERIFEPYFTSRAHGTGLGLAVSRKVVEAHGGTIACEPGDGGGARFVVLLPVKEG